MTRNTVNQLHPAIGSKVTISSGIDGIDIDAMVLDAKNSWGQVRLLVSPLAGNGTAWVQLERLRKPHSRTELQPTR